MHIQLYIHASMWHLNSYTYTHISMYVYIYRENFFGTSSFSPFHYHFFSLLRFIVFFVMIILFTKGLVKPTDGKELESPTLSCDWLYPYTHIYRHVEQKFIPQKLHTIDIRQRSQQVGTRNLYGKPQCFMSPTPCLHACVAVYLAVWFCKNLSYHQIDVPNNLI